MVDSRTRAPTLQEIAAEADVAVSTVSRALSNPQRVSRATREHVHDVARRLGYSHARTHVGDNLLCLLVNDIGNPHNASLIRGAEGQARAAGWSLVVGDAADGAEVESAQVQRLSTTVDGFLLASSRLPEAELRSIGQRVVLFNREVPGFPSVIIDSLDGSRQIIEHLAALGHRSIAYLAGPPDLWSEAQRWQGLSTNAERLGLDIVRAGPFAPTLDQGVAAADVGLSTGATAFVAFNDLMAIGILQRLRRRGIAVPGSISVVGYDDIFGAAFCQPSLTTVVAAAEQAGRTLVGLALGRIESRPDTPISIPTQLVVRDSTGPVGGRST
jgi:DNA-binding LacI/PurR family transcriptional regulator